ncbi:MAG: hypothetical protein R2867_00585 [Caldilineaceae bacterium]
MRQLFPTGEQDNRGRSADRQGMNQASHWTHEKSALALAGERQLFDNDRVVPLPV